MTTDEQIIAAAGEPVAYQSARNGFICKENKNPEYNIGLYTADAILSAAKPLRDEIERLKTIVKGAEDNGCEVVEDTDGNYWVVNKSESKLQQHLDAANEEIKRLHGIIDANIDRSIDKIMSMSDEQVSAFAGYEGRNPDDQETIARKCLEVAVCRAEIKELRERIAELESEVGRLKREDFSHERLQADSLKLANKVLAEQNAELTKQHNLLRDAIEQARPVMVAHAGPNRLAYFDAAVSEATRG